MYKLIFFITTIAFINTPLKADELLQQKEQLLEAIGAISSMDEDLKTVGVIPPLCEACTPTDKYAVHDLNTKEIDIGHPYYVKNNQPYILHLKRGKNSPNKVILKLKNGHTDCASSYIGPVSTIPGANWTIECFMEKTVYEDEEIELDLKKFPLANNEDQLIAIKLTKPYFKRRKYNVDAEIIKGPNAKIKIDKKFWGTGFNIEMQN